LEQYATLSFASGVRIERAALRGDAGLIGAAALARAAVADAPR
jgi:glucokinase